MKLEFLEPTFSVCQLAGDAEVPAWATGTVVSITRTDDELTIIVPQENVPRDAKAQHDFACFRVTGNIAFDVIGVIAGISGALASSKIPILSISTYNTDYFLVSNANREPARLALINAGYEFKP